MDEASIALGRTAGLNHIGTIILGKEVAEKGKIISGTQSSVPGMGFNGIAAAFLGGLNPIGAIFASFFIQHITDGGQYVNTNFYSSQISDLISSVIIYLCGFVLFIKITMTNMLNRSEEKKIQRSKAPLADSGKDGDK